MCRGLVWSLNREMTEVAKEKRLLIASNAASVMWLIAEAWVWSYSLTKHRSYYHGTREEQTWHWEKQILSIQSVLGTSQLQLTATRTIFNVVSLQTPYIDEGRSGLWREHVRSETTGSQRPLSFLIKRNALWPICTWSLCNLWCKALRFFQLVVGMLLLKISIVCASGLRRSSFIWSRHPDSRSGKKTIS